MIRMKENYYIKKYYGDFVLLKRAKNKENCKKVLEKVGVYGTLREVKEAIIKEMIKDEVNHRRYCDLVYPAQAGNQRIFRNFRQPTQLKIKFPCALARKIARKLI